MTRITDISQAREQKELQEFLWIDKFIHTKEDDPEFIDFTDQGRVYYQRWFTRYGYSVEAMKAFSSFCEVVRQVLKLRISEAPELDPKDPLMQEIDKAITNSDSNALIEIATRIKTQKAAENPEW